MTSQPQNPHRTYKILTVDDTPNNLYLLDRLLGTLPHVEAIKAYDGNTALALTLEHEFCLAIVDVQMPEMDGYELVELLRGNQATAQLPVIFVSAILSDEYYHRKGYDVGAVDFMSKPFNLDILLSKVRVFINLYEQRIQIQEWNQALERMVEQRTNELSLAYERLALLDQAKNDFIQVAGHELRTPLTVISGYTSALRSMLKHEPAALQMVEGIQTGQERLLEVINNMLYVSRIDNEVLQVLPQMISLNEILKKIQMELQDALDERKLTLNLQELDRLPMIEGDPDLLPKAFNYLIVNAIKYTPDGGSITISGSTLEDRDAQWLEIRIQDTGIGINPEHLDLIFEKFFQTGQVNLHSSSKTKFKGGGPGLGLPIARGIIAAHQGSIWAESPGYDETQLPGSTFFIRLPVVST
ncbi:MAG TPA: hypothetical protein DEH25_03255 [Chloroflexi bacterium]|nr:hypothetical protein [Chloroflexota bacterium]